MPHLKAAGANLTRVTSISAVEARTEHGTVEHPPVLPDDIAQIETVVARTEARLLIIDVLMAYLSGSSNSYRDQDVRQALAPLASMAERTGCCVLMLRHLRKSGGSSAIYAGGGSIGITGAARVVLLVGLDPDDANEPDPNRRRRAFAVTKNNLAPTATSLSYRIVTRSEIARIEWLGDTRHSADDLVVRDAHPSRQDDKQQFLLELLEDGPVAVGDVELAAKHAGYTLKQLRRPLAQLGGSSCKGQRFHGSYSWSLPHHNNPENSQDDRISIRETSETSGQSQTIAADGWAEIPL